MIKPKAFANLRRLSSVELGRGVQNIASINKEYNFYEQDTIKSGVFHNCTSLKTITIPKQLKDISGAFRNCTDLTSVILEEGVTDIEGAFVGCSKLSSITIPNSIVNIEGAFVKCKELKTAIIGNGVEYWKQAFQDCKSLKDVTLSDGITNIGNDGGYDGIFEGCESLSTINIPNGVTRIADKTFDGSGLVSVVLPNSVTELGKGAFANCEKLTSVTLSNQMTVIKGAEDYYNQNATFYNCKVLTALTIPANITTIEKGAFFESGLTSVTLEATTPPQIENYIGLFVDQYDENNYNSTPKLTKVKTIYVPASSLSAYQNAEGWKDLATNGINLLPKP